MESTYSLIQCEKYGKHHRSQSVSTRTSQENCGGRGAFILRVNIKINEYTRPRFEKTVAFFLSIFGDPS